MIKNVIYIMTQDVEEHTTCQSRHVEYVMIIIHSNVRFLVHVACIELHTCHMYGAHYVLNIECICVHYATHKQYFELYMSPQ